MGSSVPVELASVHPVVGIPVVEGEGRHMPAVVVHIGPVVDPDPEALLLGRLGTLEHLQRRAK